MALISLAGNKYALAKVQGRDIYSSGKRVTQGIPSDDFEIALEDWSAGMGVDYYYAKNCLLTERGRIMPRPKVTNITNSTPTTPIRYWFECQATMGDGAGAWYLYAISPTAITKIETGPGDPPGLPTGAVVGPQVGAPFSSPMRLGQPVFAPSNIGVGERRWFVPPNVDYTAPTHDASTVSKVNNGSTTTFSHTCTTDPNRFLTIWIAASGTCTFTEVSYNGISATLVGSRAAGSQMLYCYELVAPATGAHNVVVTISETRDLVVTASSWKNIDQDAPRGGGYATSGGTGTSAELNMGTVLTGETVLAGLVAGNATAAVDDETQRWNDIQDSTRGAGSSEDGDGSVISMDWTLGASVDWGMVGLRLRAASADKIMRLTTCYSPPPAGPSDTWEAITTVEEGAGHFQELPSGKIVRSLKDITGVTAAQAKVSLLAAGADMEVDANWAADFPVASEAYPITGLLSYDELLVVGKTNNQYAAEEREDGTLRWRELLPDARYMDEGDIEDRTVHQGMVWHTKMYLPTPHNWWRHDLYGCLPVSPDQLSDNPGDEPNLTGQIKGGVIPTGAHGGAWHYAPYNLPGGGFHILAARERRPGENGDLELVWHSIVYEATGVCQGVHVQRNGEGGPRLFFGRGTYGADIGWFDLDPDLGPFAVGESFGELSGNGTVYGNEYRLESLGLLREQELEIESGNAELSWQPQVTRDGGAVENVGSSMTASGKSYWTPRTNDTARRIRPCLKWTGSGSYTPTGNKTRVRKWITRGTYLPSVADQIVCTVDVLDTVKLRGGVTEQNIRDELDALVKTGAKALVDLHDRTHEVVVEDVQEQPAPHVAGLEGRHVVGVYMKVVEYS